MALRPALVKYIVLVYSAFTAPGPLLGILDLMAADEPHDEARQLPSSFDRILSSSAW